MSCSSCLTVLVLAGLSVTQATVSAAETRKVMDVSISFFSKTDTTEGTVRELARETLLQGIFGFENVAGSAPPVSVYAVDSNVGDVLREICRQDRRYDVVETADPEIVNFVASDRRVKGHDVLEFHIPRLDIETDAWPQNLISDLPSFSPELRKYLAEVYVREGGTITKGNGAVAGIAGDIKPPHFSIHLRDVSVREALNSIAVQSFRLYKAAGRDPRLVSTPNELRIVPTGWEFRFRSPGNMSLEVWVHRIFTFLE
jgi:hypothetical protein